MPAAFSPRFVTQFDIAQPDHNFVIPPNCSKALVLVRHGTVPLGLIPVESFSHSPREALEHAIATNLAVDSELISQSQSEQEMAINMGPSFSVIVCTKNRESVLKSCLHALCRQTYPNFEVVVVDNTSGSAAVRRLVDGLETTTPVRLVAEPEGGLSRARNRGARVSEGSVLAYIDDDAVPDDYWITELAAGHMVAPGVAAVNGVILPPEINTEAQEWFFQYGGHSKGRGFGSYLFDPSLPGSQSPLYPLPPFGAASNMSIRRDALIEVGGFDEALGAGTPARGAEETSVFTHLLLAGHVIAYRPTAVVWHADRADFGDLVSQMQALGTSLTAYYTSLLFQNPALLPKLLALLPQGLRDLRGKPGSIRVATMSDAYPPELLRSNRRGMLSGPFGYARGKWQCRGRPNALTESA